MDQLDNDPVVQGDFQCDATFEEVKHPFVVSLEQIAGHENYICIEVSRWSSPIRKSGNKKW